MIVTLKYIALSFFMIISVKSNATTSFSEGVEAFNKEDYALSIEKFDSIIATTPTNISAYFNFGLANMKLQNYGEAIWGFQKVLKMNPSDVESKEKIQEAQYLLNENDFWEYRLNGFQSTLYSITANIWGILIIICSFIIALSIMAFRKNESYSNRRLFLLIGSVCAVILIFSFIIGSLAKEHNQSNNLAIITSKNVLSINEQAPLAEGSLVEVIENKTDQVLIKTSQGVQLLVKLDALKAL